MKNSKESQMILKMNQQLESEQMFSVFLLNTTDDLTCYMRESHNYNFLGLQSKDGCSFKNNSQNSFTDIKKFPPVGESLFYDGKDLFIDDDNQITLIVDNTGYATTRTP